MTHTLAILLLFCLSLTAGFKHVFVLVVDENAYTSAISAKGELKNYYYGSQNHSIVTTLQSQSVSWRIFTDNFKDCYLAPSSYSHLVSDSDLSTHAMKCMHVSNAAKLPHVLMSHASNLPAVSFYFPEKGGDANWIRGFMYPLLGDPKFLEQTLTVILSPGQNGSHSMLLLQKHAKTDVEQEAKRIETMRILNSYGFTVTAPPPATNPVWFERIFTIVMENQPLVEAMKHKQMRNLAVQGTLLTDFNAQVNPSQPNYFALSAGDLMGVANDNLYDVTGRFIVDLLEEKEVSWKAYMENYPSNCYTGAKSPDHLYVRKHNPFISFQQVRETELCNKIVHSDQLYKDVATDTLPRYSFYTPNMDNNGHDTGLDFSSKWLERFIVPLLKNQNFMKGTLVVLTYDEGIKPNNKIYTLLLGDMIPFGHLDNTSYTHYSLLKLTEEQFSLNSLGRNDENATVIDAVNFYPGDIEYSFTLPFYAYIIIGAAGALVLGIVGVVIFVKRRKARKEAQERKALVSSTDSV